MDRGRLGAQLTRDAVGELSVDAAPRKVFQSQTNFRLNGQRSRRMPGALCRELRGPRHLCEIDNPQQEHKRIPGKHGIDEPSIEECRPQPHQPYEEEYEKTIAEGNADALV